MAQIKLNATYGLTGTLPAVSGANLTTLNASNISSGTLSTSRYVQGGITEADMFVLASTYDSGASGNKTFTNEFSRVANDTPGRIGTGISLDTSNGKYTFGSTGVYLIILSLGANVGSGDNEAGFNLLVNGSTVNYLYVGASGGGTTSSKAATATFLLDVDSSGSSGDYVQIASHGDGVNFQGASTYHQCAITFIRIGDT
jgi:hypothetical protein